MDRPIADQSEKRPPTQSRKGKTRSGAMPNSAVAFRLVESAAKCWPAPASPTAARSQSRTSAALVMVSWVVKVFEATSTRVRAGSSCGRNASQACASTFAR